MIWVDQDGHTHMGANPPADITPKAVKDIPLIQIQ